MLAKDSFVGHKNMRRSIDEYEQLKRTMSNNRKVLHPSSVFKSSLPAIDKRREMMSESCVKKNVTISYHEESSFNPEFMEHSDEVIE